MNFPGAAGKRKMKVGYINPEIPGIELPEICGTVSEALVPDTRWILPKWRD
jgi:hypothetical protein